MREELPGPLGMGSPWFKGKIFKGIEHTDCHWAIQGLLDAGARAVIPPGPLQRSGSIYM